MGNSWKGSSTRNITAITLTVFNLLTHASRSSHAEAVTPPLPKLAKAGCAHVQIIGTFTMDERIASVLVWKNTEAARKFTFQSSEAKRLAPGASSWVGKNVLAELKRPKKNAEHWTLIALRREPARLNRYTQEALRCLRNSNP